MKTKQELYREQRNRNQKAYYRRNKEKVMQKQADRRKNYPERDRKHRLKQKYGITIDEYFDMLIAQRGTCALCDRVSSDETHGVLSVDHCHVTNRVRGLLCSQCNRALGILGDQPQSLLNAYNYLVKNDLD
jgi:Recombination endonuclease VII